MAKAVVTQVMFIRFDVTTGKNPDRSEAFNGLTFLRGLLCCRITGFLFAIVIPVSERLRHLECLSLWLPSPKGLGARVSARSQMRPTKRLTAVVSKLSTVRMIDELSLQLSAYAPFQARSGTKAAGWRRSPLSCSPGATILMLVAFLVTLLSWQSDGRSPNLISEAQICVGVSVRWSGAMRMRVVAEGPAALSRLS